MTSSKRVLIFKSIGICYNATSYYCDVIGNGLSKLGYSVDYVEFFQNSIKDNIDELYQIEPGICDIIIDINSSLPQICNSQGINFPDYMGVPFYNYIIDHPLYHHDSLSVPCKDYNVICLDKNHSDYVRKYYPHIKNIGTMMLTGGIGSICKDYCDREYDVLFVGTYTSTRELDRKINRLNQDLQHEIRQLIEYMRDDRSLTMENALHMLIDSLGVKVSDSLFPKYMNTFFLADTYMRAYDRESILYTLLNSGIQVYVCGHGYDRLRCRGRDNLHIIADSLDFTHTFNLYGNAKIALNYNPLFVEAAHDRFFTGSLNGAAVLSNNCEFINDNYTPNYNVNLYDMNRLEELPHIVMSMLSDTGTLSDTALRAKNISLSSHTWDTRSMELNKILKNNALII